MLKKLSDNLNLLMEKAELNSSQLAKLIDLPATTIKRIRTNDQSNPTVLTLLPIANHFSVTINQLLGLEKFQSKAERAQPLKMIPILSWQECIDFKSLNYDECSKRIYTEANISNQSYCLIVEDDNVGFFPKKSRLIIDPNILPESGDYVITAKRKSATASIKKYIVETDDIYLKSLIEGINIIPLTSDYQLLGTITQYKVELKKI